MSGTARLPRRQAIREVWAGLATVGLPMAHPSLPGRLAHHARRRPDDPAFTDAQGTLTFADLHEQVTAAAARITARTITVSADDSRTTLLLALAGLRAGAAVRLRNRRLGGDDAAALRSVDDLPEAKESSRRAATWGLGRLVVHTSGSTGGAVPVATRWHPGVAWQQLGLLGRLPLREVASVGVMVPLDRGHGFGTAAFCLVAGRHLVDLSASGVPLGGTRVPVVTCLPRHLERLVEHRVAGLQHVVCGSEPLPADLAGRTEQALGVQVWNCYGMTETGTVCVATPDDRALDPHGVGRPLAGVTIREVDGLLHVSSPQAGRTVAGDLGKDTGDGRVVVEGRVRPSAHAPA
ncbi:AMP-binding protein [Aestuariimicrobium ganziense]|uniref:AMP-binding protein n=1 Tax=Aestuariimicrobium ganziense TaxID=2773677 RepID=UPI001945B2A4|nr:AMP-binding protein [Aestuariimicrobium ganziense]